MVFELKLSSLSVQKYAAAEIEKCNDFTARYGLVLTPGEAVELAETRAIALKSNGRIEFGGGVIGKIIAEFCSSPYISMHNYAETLHDLTEMFYYYKNESLDLICDEDLIKFMKVNFDGKCQGSLELLSGRELANLARNLRYGYAPDNAEDNDDSEEEYDDGEY